MSTATAPARTSQPARTNRTSTQLSVSGDDLDKLELIARDCGMASLSGEANRFGRALKLASGIRQLKSAMTPAIMAVITDLQGTSLGFKTDKDKDGGYDVETVKECAIECILRGGQLVGNEMNIIASRFYATKEFFTRILREFPGLTDLELRPGTASIGSDPKKAYVSFTATWKLNGKPDRMDRVATKGGPDGKTLVDDTRIVVKVNSGQTDDAIMGKAERKMRAAIYSRITGTVVSDGDIDESRTIVVAQGNSRIESLAQRLGAVEGETPLNGDASREPGDDTDIESASAGAQSSNTIAPPEGGQLSAVGEAFVKKFEAATGDYDKLLALIEELVSVYKPKGKCRDPEGNWLYARLDEFIASSKKK